VKKKFELKNWTLGLVALAVATVVFVIPFFFIFLTAAKTADESAVLSFDLPKEWRLWENFVEVLQTNDFMILRAFNNSFWLTVFTVTIVAVLAAMVAWIIDRRGGRIAKIANFLVLSGLMIPPAVVPTIFLLQGLGIYGSFPSMILIEIAFHASFTTMLFRAFISSIPKELDEAAILDGANSIQLFFRVIFPLLKSVIVTAIILNSVSVFNDFVNPLYFLAGEGTETVQLTLYNFNSQYVASYNLLFMDILIITIPMVIMFAIFNKRIVAGMTAGAVKG
jgi:raffinose/stachyose/melibiose transport system permease protein